jgi:hypothetical protein
MWSASTPDVSARDAAIARLEAEATELKLGLSQMLAEWDQFERVLGETRDIFANTPEAAPVFDSLAPEIAALKAAIKRAREAIGKETQQ